MDFKFKLGRGSKLSDEDKAKYDALHLKAENYYKSLKETKFKAKDDIALLQKLIITLEAMNSMKRFNYKDRAGLQVLQRMLKMNKSKLGKYLNM